MNETMRYKASAFRKTFNIISLVLNIIHLSFALFYFSMVVVLALIGGVFVLLIEGSMEEFLWPFIGTSIYLIPAMVIFILSIVSLVKCFRYGYKKTLEMATYVVSIVFNIVDIVIAVIIYDFLGNSAAFLTISCSFISIVLFTVAAIACVIDKRK